MGFSKATFQFLSDLEANNDKAWFEDNRAAYKAHWKAPALDFIAEVSAEMTALDPALRAEPKLNGSLRRINRDVRFSKDKSPYNARLHLVFWAGDHPNRSPGVHFVLAPDGVGYGAGQWGIDPKALGALRNRIVTSDGEALEQALKAAEQIGCRMDAPDLVRVPKGFDVDRPRSDLLRYKGFVARTHDNPAAKSKIIGAGAKVWVLEVTQTLLPLVRWLHA